MVGTIAAFVPLRNRLPNDGLRADYTQDRIRLGLGEILGPVQTLAPEVCLGVDLFEKIARTAFGFGDLEENVVDLLLEVDYTQDRVRLGLGEILGPVQTLAPEVCLGVDLFEKVARTALGFGDLQENVVDLPPEVYVSAELDDRSP